MLSAVLLAIVQSLLTLPVALLIGYLFDHAIKQHNVRLMVLVGVGIMLLYLTGNALALLGRDLSLKLTKEVIQSIREELVTRFLAFPQSYYDRANRSQLHTVAVQDTERLDVMSNALISVVLPAGIMSIGFLAILFYLNWTLSIALFVTLLPLYALSSRVKTTVGRLVFDFQRSFERFSQGIHFLLYKIELIRTLGVEPRESQRQKREIAHLREISRRMALMQATSVATQGSVLTIAGMIVLLLGGWMTGNGNMTIGDLFAYYFTVGLMRTQTRSLISALPHLIEGKASLNSLCGLLQTPIEPFYKGTRKVPAGRLTLKRVTFHYGDHFALRELNMEIPSRGITAITGQNGAGKSTILHLILGFYAPQYGELLVEGIPYGSIDIRFLRKTMGVVPQAPLLFRGSVRDNIAYGLQVEDEEVKRAAKIALAHEFIARLPQGYHTIIGDRGIRLSGGERQRIAIARAILRRPAMMLLDEPMNHLDKEMMLHLMKTFEEMSERIGILIISHSIEVIRCAHHVYHLEEGKVVFSGDPEAYLQKIGASVKGNGK